MPVESGSIPLAVKGGFCRLELFMDSRTLYNKQKD